MAHETPLGIEKIVEFFDFFTMLFSHTLEQQLPVRVTVAGLPMLHVEAGELKTTVWQRCIIVLVV